MVPGRVDQAPTARVDAGYPPVLPTRPAHPAPPHPTPRAQASCPQASRPTTPSNPSRHRSTLRCTPQTRPPPAPATWAAASSPAPPRPVRRVQTACGPRHWRLGVPGRATTLTHPPQSGTSWGSEGKRGLSLSLIAPVPHACAAPPTCPALPKPLNPRMRLLNSEIDPVWFVMFFLLRVFRFLYLVTLIPRTRLLNSEIDPAWFLMFFC